MVRPVLQLSSSSSESSSSEKSDSYSTTLLLSLSTFSLVFPSSLSWESKDLPGTGPSCSCCGRQQPGRGIDEVGGLETPILRRL